MYIRHHFNPRSRGGSDELIRIDREADKYFNPRSRGGSDSNAFSHLEETNISIHAPAEGATVTSFSAPLPFVFQSTLPRRERHKYILSASIVRYFNPRSRGGSDSVFVPGFVLRSIFQSTLPRRERRLPYPVLHLWNCISIHAPAEGATLFIRSQLLNYHISIHAPAEGATYCSPAISYRCIFQSTLPRRERQSLYIEHICLLIISIHAPAEGATNSSGCERFRLHISIHAPAEGATFLQAA